MKEIFAVVAIVISAALGVAVGVNSTELSIRRECEHFGKAYVNDWVLMCKKERNK